jgi:hypothetical protein
MFMGGVHEHTTRIAPKPAIGLALTVPVYQCGGDAQLTLRCHSLPLYAHNQTHTLTATLTRTHAHAGLLAGYRSEDVRADVRLRVVLASGSKAEELIGKVSTHACRLSARHPTMCHHAQTESTLLAARIKHVHNSRAWITLQHRNLIFE